MYWRLSQNLALHHSILLQLSGLVVLFLGFVLALLWRSAWRLGDSVDVSGWGLVVGLLLTYIPHELVHGISMRWQGARPQFGVIVEKYGFFAFYTTAPGYAFRRSAYCVITLAPLMGLSALYLLLLALIRDATWAGAFVLALAFNLSGSVGDLYIAGMLLPYPASAFVIDERDGVRIFLPSEQHRAWEERPGESRERGNSG